MMGAEENQPDWDQIAEKFDHWLPQLAPVGEALISALQAQAGTTILDVASGTGEPALSLARQLGDQASITGIDAAPGMVHIAQAKAERECLNNIRFQAMPAEQMDFADRSFDRVLCRFGVMLFHDPLQGLKEMHRVLKDGGRFAIAVWSTAETMPTLCWTYEVFKGRIAEDLYPPLPKVTSLGPPGIVESLMSAAGFANFRVEKKTLHYQFASFDDYWDTVEASDILKMQYDALPADQRDSIRDEVARFARDFVQDGRLIIPHEYLLVSGDKNP